MYFFYLEQCESAGGRGSVQMSGTADLRGEDSAISEEETASQETGLCRPFGRREGLREVCLDKQCVSSTIYI